MNGQPGRSDLRKPEAGDLYTALVAQYARSSSRIRLINLHEEQTLLWLIAVSIGIMVFLVPLSDGLMGGVDLIWVPFTLWPFFLSAVLGMLTRLLMGRVIAQDARASEARWGELLSLPHHSGLSDREFWEKAGSVVLGRAVAMKDGPGGSGMEIGARLPEHGRLAVLASLATYLSITCQAIFLFGIVWVPYAVTGFLESGPEFRP